LGNIEKAIARIKSLECPTGEVENKIAEILEEYKVANRDEIQVSRKEIQDEIDLQHYSAVISGKNKHNITILSDSGLDDYVAVVVDAYTE
jgi:LEA14-like dessication related protein